MKKYLKFLGLCCVTVIIAIGIYTSIPQKKLDFRGTVTEIKEMDSTITFYIENQAIKSSNIVVANSNTKVSYCHEDDPEITLTDIKVDDTIEGDYRWHTKDNIAKYITVLYTKQ